MAIGPHRLEYEVLEGWEQLPEGWSFVEVAGVAVDSQDRVYVFNRGAHPMIVFDKEGRFLDAWGEGVFASPHGIFIDRHDHVYCADNFDHTVRKFTTDGELLMTLGDPAKPADTGFKVGHSPVRYAGGPFNMVTNVAVTPSGEMFISDGYGNARVHRFSPEGELLASWGEPGSGPGQFNLPHSIAVDRGGRVFVADRENSRLQIFTSGGEFLASWDWVNRPDDLFIDDQENLYIAELGWNVPHREVPHFCWSKRAPAGHAPIARVTICDLDGNIQTQIGGYGDPLLPGNFIVPHGIWADSRGDFYVGEVVKASGAIDHFAPLTCHAFQKFVRAG
jgi:DNA-binding beta-propeller fold protein YncE